MGLIVYNLLLLLALPFTPLKLLWRGIKQPAYRQHWGERFGFFSHPVTQPIIWLHCVSVGETQAAKPFVARLQAAYPNHQILITHGTPTGRETSEQLFGDSVWRAYLPYDVPFVSKRFVQHFKPALGIIMETELWFNLIRQCHEQDIPVCLLNARMSAKSANGYSKFAKLVRNGLRRLSVVAAQTAADAQRLTDLGATDVQITGNCKFDVRPSDAQLSNGTTLRGLLHSQRPIFIAASTRDGEEPMILDAVAGLDLLTIIVPRHPQRFDTVAALLESRQVRYRRKTEITQAIDADTQVILGDTMGELFAYYAASDIALVGGSLQPLGGQNLIEPAAVGKPILLGPHTFNFALASQQAIDAGAAKRVDNVASLRTTLTLLCEDDALRTQMGEAASQFSQMHRGATERMMQLVSDYLQ